MKQKVTRQELVELLRRNVLQYRDDAEFTQYVIDLALYLVEYRLHQSRELDRTRSMITGSPTEVNPAGAAENHKTVQEYQSVLKRHGTPRSQQATCRMCGAPTEGKTICPHCGNMT
jgi:hypothetical protein